MLLTILCLPILCPCFPHILVEVWISIKFCVNDAGEMKTVQKYLKKLETQGEMMSVDQKWL